MSDFVYVAVNGTGPVGTTPSDAIVRVPKSGGKPDHRAFSRTTVRRASALTP
jgi:hypothetical protein